MAELEQVAGRAAELATAAEVPETARRELYFQARSVKRRIAFCNPLLADIDQLLFLKRHDSVGVYHMCDQYYGCNAKPGGGLFVLENPFGEHPRLINLLENSVVENGRLKGQKLDGGSFLSPEVSWDGKTILFAYSQAGAWEKNRGKETYLWTPECSYHIFKVNADGTGLVQLTDGDGDDFDPCVLPNGRIAFISERRGGYLRCGRHCPVYTMFSMRPDGSDIICLSYHETHEWHPSVTNDGMLVYTRWDYVDRDTNIAHHIWTSYPGRPRPAQLPRQLSDAPRRPALDGDEHPGDSGLEQVRRLDRRAPRARVRLAGADRPARRGRRRHVAADPAHAGHAVPRSGRAARGCSTPATARLGR